MIQKQDQKLKNMNVNAFKQLTEKLKSQNISAQGGLANQARIGQGNLLGNSTSNRASNVEKYELKLTTQITEDHLQFDGSVLPITVKRTDSLLIKRIPF